MKSLASKLLEKKASRLIKGDYIYRAKAVAALEAFTSLLGANPLKRM